MRAGCGLHHAVTPRDIAAQLHIVIAQFFKQVTRCSSIGGIDFEKEQAAWFQVPQAKTTDGAIEDQRVVVGHEEGKPRLMLQYNLRHLGRLVFADVGRIADKDIELLINLLTSGIFDAGIVWKDEVINIAKYIKLSKLDVINMLLTSVLAGNVQSCC